MAGCGYISESMTADQIKLDAARTHTTHWFRKSLDHLDLVEAFDSRWTSRGRNSFSDRLIEQLQQYVAPFDG